MRLVEIETDETAVGHDARITVPESSWAAQARGCFNFATPRELRGVVGPEDRRVESPGMPRLR